MKKADLVRFGITLGVVAEACDKPAPSGELIAMYFKFAGRDGFSINEWEQRVERYIRTMSNTFWPTYSKLAGKTKIDIKGNATMQANLVLSTVKTRGASGVPVSWEDPRTDLLMRTRFNYSRLCATLMEATEAFWVRDFVDAYIELPEHVQHQIESGIEDRLKALTHGIGSMDDNQALIDNQPGGAK